MTRQPIGSDFDPHVRATVEAESIRRKAEAVLSTYQGAVDEEMKSAVGTSKLPLYEMIRYHLGWADERFGPVAVASGKKLRPALCLLVCEMVGGDWRRAVPAGAALELLHNFSLVHDDIQDQSEERRHRRTVWRLWGEAQGINVGDGMHVIAEAALLRLRYHGYEADLVLRAADLLHEACLALTEGQYLDMSFEQRSDVSTDEYLQMIGKKTGALIACSMGLGALLGGADDGEVALFRRFGTKLGLAFQIRDDFLGIWGDSKQTGKSTASDILSRKKSLPVVFALQQASGETRRQLQAYYQSSGTLEGEVEAVVALLESLGAAKHTESLADQLYREALDELADLSDNRAVDDLRMVAEYLVYRYS